MTIALAILAALALIIYGAIVTLIAQSIRRGNPSTERPIIIRRETTAVVVMFQPRLDIRA